MDIFDWDVLTWSRAIEIWEKEIDGEKKCLEIGANKGGLSLWLALNGHNVLCTDIDNPKERAAPIHSKHQVGHLINYAALDILDSASQVEQSPDDSGHPNNLSRKQLDRSPIAKTSDPSIEIYDFIIFKSVLGGISRDNNFSLAKEAIDNMHALLKPGGTLLFAENLRGSVLHRLARKLFVKWGSSWNYLTFSELEELFSNFDYVEIKTTGFATAFAKGKKLNGLMNFFDNWIFNRVFGRRMKYVGYGKGKKIEKRS